MTISKLPVRVHHPHPFDIKDAFVLSVLITTNPLSLSFYEPTVNGKCNAGHILVDMQDDAAKPQICK
jgi:hypothetical protein